MKDTFVAKQDNYLEATQSQSAKLTKNVDREIIGEWQKTAAMVVEKIRQSLDLEVIFHNTTSEVRKMFNADRVLIYRFNDDWSGEFISESVTSEWTCLMQEQQNLPELLANVSECSLKHLAISPEVDTYLKNTQGGNFAKGQVYRVCNDIYNAGFSDCYIQLLESYEARAYVIVAIYFNDKIWGLLAVYQNDAPREWQNDEIFYLTQIATHLGVGLQQAELLKQTQSQKEQLARTLKELQNTQAQLIQNEKMTSLGQLVAGIAHEINNPANFIYANISCVENYMEDAFDLLKIYRSTYPKPESHIQEKSQDIDLDFIIDDLPQLLNSMYTGVKRIKNIILDLRTFSCLDEAEIKSVNIHEGIDSTLLILQHRMNVQPSLPGIKLLKKYGNLPEVECYPAQLNQVFMNILTNAIDTVEEKFSHSNFKETGQIQIHTEVVNESYILISISDNGWGIASNIMDRIFDPFFTTKEPGQGTGLGLSISYQIIVNKHGGKLECFSQVGKGSEFRIEIPITNSLNTRSSGNDKIAER